MLLSATAALFIDLSFFLVNCCFVPCPAVVAVALFEATAYSMNTGDVCVLTPAQSSGGYVCVLPHFVKAGASQMSGWTPSLTWSPLKAVWGWKRRGETIGSKAARIGSVPCGQLEPLFIRGIQCECWQLA